MHTNNYSADQLWGGQRFDNITSMQNHADELYFRQHKERILESGSLYLLTANTALKYTLEVPDARARDFLLKDKVLNLYSHAHTCLYKFITGTEYHEHNELNIDVFKRFLDTVSKYSALALRIKEFEIHEANIRAINHVNSIIKITYPAHAGPLFIAAANKAKKSNFPALVQLKLYAIALEYLALEFYDNHKRPNDNVIECYKDTMEMTVDLAYKTSNTEHGWKEYEIKYRQMQEMFARLKKLGININFKVASGYAGKKIEPLPSTLRKRRPTPGDF